jgi:hypothetical protein
MVGLRVGRARVGASQLGAASRQAGGPSAVTLTAVVVVGLTTADPPAASLVAEPLPGGALVPLPDVRGSLTRETI